MVAHLPNLLTALRLVLCIALFAILGYAQSVLVVPIDGLAVRALASEPAAAHASLQGGDSHLVTLFHVAFGLFLLAYVTDVLDGWIARKYQVVSPLGEIADPIVDKILILGSLVLLVPLTAAVQAWMVVVVATREFLVSGLRSYAASQGTSVRVNWWGKWKLFGQSFAIGTGLVYLAHPAQGWIETLFVVLVWIAIAATIASGARYCLDARRALAEVDATTRAGLEGAVKS